ncbi:unnamed protein product [Notodromas monacha]|uniref:Fanconi anemia group M protein n=1 Tax=Notodromas monacha TaxID=399045 RepID=A0A7R9BHQ2_9CRUS|nr:unnamed protein product [Notodromas monacha]CAG0914927.1 unnamed protein product [Notodromas monacha]
MNGIPNETAESWVFPTGAEERVYQLTISERALKRNTLVCLPTGLGKTFIAAVLMYNFYRWFPDGIFIFMAPTRPLVKQQKGAMLKFVPLEPTLMVELTGTMKPENRNEMWLSKQFLFMTPQVMTNDISRGVVPLDRVRLLIVDEAHRATGDHAYVIVINKLWENHKEFRVLALTATPGKDETRIYEIAETYVQDLQRVNVVQTSHRFLSRFKLIQCMEELRAKGGSFAGSCLSLVTFCVSLYYGIELLEQHGLRPFYNHFQAILSGEKNPEVKTRLLKDERFMVLMRKLRENFGVMGKGFVIGHPKLEKLRDVVLEHFQKHDDRNTKIMIFSQEAWDSEEDLEEEDEIYRESVEDITALLKNFEPMVRARSFVGQTSSGKNTKGITQKEQLKVVKEFSSKTNAETGFNVLVCTCVAEEGLDIDDVDLIICFDSNRSPIRLIQRMGRTGRKAAGKMIALCAEGKEAEAYLGAMRQRNVVNRILCDKNISKNLMPPIPWPFPEGKNLRCERMAHVPINFESPAVKSRAKPGVAKRERKRKVNAKHVSDDEGTISKNYAGGSKRLHSKTNAGDLRSFLMNNSGVSTKKKRGVESSPEIITIADEDVDMERIMETLPKNFASDDNLICEEDEILDLIAMGTKALEELQEISSRRAKEERERQRKLETYDCDVCADVFTTLFRRFNPSAPVTPVRLSPPMSASAFEVCDGSKQDSLEALIEDNMGNCSEMEFDHVDDPGKSKDITDPQPGAVELKTSTPFIRHNNLQASFKPGKLFTVFESPIEASPVIVKRDSPDVSSKGANETILASTTQILKAINAATQVLSETPAKLRKFKPTKLSVKTAVVTSPKPAKSTLHNFDDISDEDDDLFARMDLDKLKSPSSSREDVAKSVVDSRPLAGRPPLFASPKCSTIDRSVSEKKPVSLSDCRSPILSTRIRPVDSSVQSCAPTDAKAVYNLLDLLSDDSVEEIDFEKSTDLGDIGPPRSPEFQKVGSRNRPRNTNSGTACVRKNGSDFTGISREQVNNVALNMEGMRSSEVHLATSRKKEEAAVVFHDLSDLFDDVDEVQLRQVSPTVLVEPAAPVTPVVHTFDDLVCDGESNDSWLLDAYEQAMGTDADKHEALAGLLPDADAAKKLKIVSQKCTTRNEANSSSTLAHGSTQRNVHLNSSTEHESFELPIARRRKRVDFFEDTRESAGSADSSNPLVRRKIGHNQSKKSTKSVSWDSSTIDDDDDFIIPKRSKMDSAGESRKSTDEAGSSRKTLEISSRDVKVKKKKRKRRHNDFLDDEAEVSIDRLNSEDESGGSSYDENELSMIDDRDILTQDPGVDMAAVYLRSVRDAQPKHNAFRLKYESAVPDHEVFSQHPGRDTAESASDDDLDGFIVDDVEEDEIAGESEQEVSAVGCLSQGGVRTRRQRMQMKPRKRRVVRFSSEFMDSLPGIVKISLACGVSVLAVIAGKRAVKRYLTHKGSVAEQDLKFNACGDENIVEIEKYQREAGEDLFQKIKMYGTQPIVGSKRSPIARAWNAGRSREDEKAEQRKESILMNEILDHDCDSNGCPVINRGLFSPSPYPDDTANLPIPYDLDADSPWGEESRVVSKFIRVVHSAKRSLLICMHMICFKKYVEHLVFLRKDNPTLDLRVMVDEVYFADILVEAGIPVLQYKGNPCFGTLPGRLHSKYFIVDKKIAMLGSANWTRAAFKENFENLILSTDPLVVERLADHFESLWKTDDFVPYVQKNGEKPRPPQY